MHDPRCAARLASQTNEQLAMQGDGVGADVGAIVGATVGAAVGVAVGESVGAAVGLGVTGTGTTMPMVWFSPLPHMTPQTSPHADASPHTLKQSCMHGDGVGADVGETVGAVVGATVGAAVGMKVGAAVGEGVGLLVAGTATTMAIE